MAPMRSLAHWWFKSYESKISQSPNCHPQRRRRERTISAHERMDSSLIPTQPPATCSTRALTASTSRISARVDSTSTNTPAHASGPRMRTARDASKPRKSWKTASSARKTRARTTSRVRSSPILTSRTQKIVRSSTFASTESNRASWAAQRERFSTTRRSVVTRQKTFPDGNLRAAPSRWVTDRFFFVSSTARIGTRKATTKTKLLSRLLFYRSFPFQLLRFSSFFL